MSLQLKNIYQKISELRSAVHSVSQELESLAEIISTQVPEVKTSLLSPTYAPNKRKFVDDDSHFPAKRGRRFWQVITINPPLDSPVLVLPKFLLERMLSFLDARSVLNFSQTCKYAQSISFADSVWDCLYSRQFSCARFSPSRKPLEHSFDHFLRGSETLLNWTQGNYQKRVITTPAELYFLEVDLESPNLILTASKNDLTEWDLQTGNHSSTVHTNETGCYHFSVDRSRLALSNSEGVKLFHRKTKNFLFSIEGVFCRANRLKLASECLLIGFWDGSVKLYDANHGRLITALTGHQNPVYSIDACVPCGETRSKGLFATGSSDKTVKVWDFNSCESVYTLRGHSQTVNALQISPDCSSLFSASKDGTVQCWDLETGKSKRVFSVGKEPIHAVQIFDQFQVISGGSDTMVRCWDLRESGSGNVFSLAGHTGAVHSLCLSESCIISCGADKNIMIWDFTKF